MPSIDDGGTTCKKLARNWRPVLAMLLPLPARLDVLARMYVGGGAQHGHQVVVTTPLNPQNAEPGLGAVKCHALDKTGQRLTAAVNRTPLGHVHISLPPADN